MQITNHFRKKSPENIRDPSNLLQKKQKGRIIAICNDLNSPFTFISDLSESIQTKDLLLGGSKADPNTRQLWFNTSKSMKQFS